jgi:hypothetical protein
MKDLRQLIREKIILPKRGSGLGYSRKAMPQVETEHYAEYIEYLKDHGIHLKKTTVDPNTLKPVQSEFSKKGVEATIKKIKSGRYSEKRSIISSDKYIIDGHHRWLAYKHLNMEMPVFQADKPVDVVLETTKRFPYTNFRAHGVTRSKGTKNG